MVLLALILLIAAFLRFYRLDSSSLWSDEGNTWALLDRSFAQIAQSAAADIHPPGYYWLLKLWSSGFGASAWGMRSFSAVAGILLVYVTYRLGRHLAVGQAFSGVALVAALLAAVNPLQIYYSQEARMYLLLTLESAALFWALFAWTTPTSTAPPQKHRIAPALAYLLCGIAGLWTHYSFPIILGAAGLGFLLSLRHAPSAINIQSPHPPITRLWRFIALNFLILLAYLPWLPTAIDRVLHWPKGGEAVALVDGMGLTLQTLLFGPLRDRPALQWPWLVAAVVLPLTGLLYARQQRKVWHLVLWLLAPILLMLGLGLFSDAFLKFLLTASPAWLLLTALGICRLSDRLPGRWLWLSLGVGGAIVLALLTLPTYYTSPTARDNYAGIAQYLQAAAKPDQALVVLDAPGQQEVWRYYEQVYQLELPVLALPQQRPADRAATLQTLQNAVMGRRAVYALFWATNEADPEQLVEHWLDQQAFKGLDSWQGNLRFVTYALPTDLDCTPLTPPADFGASIQLTQLCQPNAEQTVAAGEVVVVGLYWQALTSLAQRYKVTVQLLDARQQVIAQRDSEPVGGSLPTNQWAVGQTVVDNHGLLIPPGTPPGNYQLILALYDASSGERLRLGDGADHVVLGAIQVTRPERPLPMTLLSLQHPINTRVEPVQLVGYHAYRKATAHAPDTPINRGDWVEFTFFWQAPDPLPATWPAELPFTLRLGEQRITLPLGSETYPTGQWQAGEIVSSKAEILYDGGSPVPQIQVGDAKVRLRPLPGAAWWR
jgi:mannosyltransferase